MAFSKDYLLDWQRRMDPARFNKATGAQFHTAPTIIMPDAPEYPKGVPEDSVTMMFFIEGENWILGQDCGKIHVKSPEFVERRPKTKYAKHGPIIIMSADGVYAAMTTKENYYWSGQVLSLHKIVLATFKPHKTGKDGKYRVTAVVTFLPNDDEMPNA